MKIRIPRITKMAVTGALVIVFSIAGSLSQDVQAATAQDNMPLGRQAVAISDGQYPGSYFPNTELLGPAEMRITCLGSGMPNLTRKSASLSYLVELGNGDKFLFDVGAGSMANLWSLRPDFSKIDKVFASHLHTDHVGDFMGLHIGSWLSGRYTPIHIYGPSGSTPEMGTKAFVDGMKKGYAWDIAGRSGALPDAGGEIVVHEFDYKAVNEVVYQENGVTIRSWPAIHLLDGPVSYSLEWQGLKYVFGGDTYPNKWYIKHAAGADIASHEAFLPPKALAKYFGWSLGQATFVSTRIHTEPQAFGKVMSAVKPRLAVGYHVFNDFDTKPQIMQEIRQTYDGPLALAIDYMVFNVTKDDIKVRMAVIDEAVWPQPSIYPQQAADPSKRIGFSKEMIEGRVVFDDVIKFYYDQANDMFGTDFAPPD